MWESFETFSIWLFLPMVFALMIGLMTMILCVTKMKTSPREELTSNKKYHSPQNIYYGLDPLTAAAAFACMGLLLLPCIARFDKNYSFIVESLLANHSLVATVVIGLTSITITLSVMVAVFDKGYYIVFSIHEVLKKYKFLEFISCAFISCFFVCITAMSLRKEDIQTTSGMFRFLMLEISMLYNLVADFYLICIIVYVVFSDNRRDLSLLGYLYRVFGSHEIDVLNFKPKKKWNKFAIDINAGYLTGKYIDICNKRKIRTISRMEFVTTIGYNKNKWYRQAVVKYKRMILIACGISLAINCICCQYDRMIAATNIFITELLLIFPESPMYNMNSDIVSIPEMIILRLRADTWGHSIVCKNDKKSFIPRVPWITFTTYFKYIKSMYSLIAFYVLSLKENRTKVAEKQFEKMLKCFEDIKEKNFVTYSPVFVIGFFFFYREKSIDTLRELYYQVVVKEDKKHEFQRMLDSQMLYITKYDGEDLCHYRDSLVQYIKWLER